MTISVADYLASRIADLGIDCVFGVPGDYTFSFDDAVEANPKLRWILNANELNAAYAADGYGRRFGIAALTTTYGVGELSAINGVMGSMAHNVPVIHVVGMPSLRIVNQKLITHHTLGDGDYTNFFALSATAACASSILTPQNAISEIDRLFNEALRQCRPVYIVVPHDQGKLPLIGTPTQGKHISEYKRQISVKVELDNAVESILAKLKSAKTPVVIPSHLIARFDLQHKLAGFLMRCNIPFATMPMSKGLISEAHPKYLGLYNGDYSSPSGVKNTVEDADLVIDFGGMILAELNAGLWSDDLPMNRMISIHADWVQIESHVWTNIAIGDLIDALAERAPQFGDRADLPPQVKFDLVGSSNDPTNSQNFYPRVQRMLRSGDVVVAETGTCMLHLNRMLLPEGVGFESQSVWGSIGWSTPAALGIAMANTKGRTVIVTGDGAHGMTLNELSVMGRYAIKPIIFVLKNDIHGIEDLVGDLGHVFNVLPLIPYHKLPEAMGCDDWLSAEVKTVGELDDVIERIQFHDGAAYITVASPPSESKPLPEAVRNRMYKVDTPITH